VAFYAGSLEGVSGSTSGKLLYRLAEKRCTNFGTCTGANDKSAVNAHVVAQSILGQTALVEGKCIEVIPIKRRIAALMSVPLVQGALRYAYKVDQMNGSHKELAEGAVFSAAILPLVAQCNSSAAKLISNNMKIDSSAPMQSGFTAVKQAFEATYACMDITCADVGGLILEGSTYYPMASPCMDSVPSAGQTTGGVTSSASGCQLSLAACLLVCYIVGLMKSRGPLSHQSPISPDVSGGSRPSPLVQLPNLLTRIWRDIRGHVKGAFESPVTLYQSFFCCALP